MDSYHITGGEVLRGEVLPSAAKNAVLPILAACVMVKGKTEIQNCPGLSDVHKMCEILESLGCKIERKGKFLSVDASQPTGHKIPSELMKSLRSSIFLIGPLLARLGQAEMSKPGGCAIGSRPIDLHLWGLQCLGAEISEEENKIIGKAKRLKGNRICLGFPSVGATESVMMAAVLARGETVIENPAREPEIQDLEHFLNCCGAKVSGAGGDCIRICGVEELRPCTYVVMSDRIEAGTYLAAAAVTGGMVSVDRTEPRWLEAELEILERMGCRIKREKERIHLEKSPLRLLTPGSIKAEPFPGFPTDLQSQILTLCAFAQGRSYIEDKVFESRFRCAGELGKMGADIAISGNCAMITGRANLQGTLVSATDLRGGAALVLAGLAAQGETVIENICHIDRGYDKFDIALKNLGAKIERIGEK